MNEQNIREFTRKSSDLITLLQGLLSYAEKLDAQQKLYEDSQALIAKKNKEVETKNHEVQDKERELLQREGVVTEREKEVALKSQEILLKEGNILKDKEQLAMDKVTFEKEKIAFEEGKVKETTLIALKRKYEDGLSNIESKTKLQAENERLYEDKEKMLNIRLQKVATREKELQRLAEL